MTANEPPKALPSLDPAPPATMLIVRAFSMALTVTLPTVASTSAFSMCAPTELRMSFTPIEALTAVPSPKTTATDPVPEKILETSLAMTVTFPPAEIF